MTHDALTEAIVKAGGQAGLARALGVSQPSVWHWVHRSKRVPAEYVLPVEAITGISRHDLRPDLYPREETTSAQAAA
jgi:DNA-binding transcriptional regulator YdaS (Cro superfamily)